MDDKMIKYKNLIKTANDLSVIVNHENSLYCLQKAYLENDKRLNEYVKVFMQSRKTFEELTRYDKR
jgi:hypothetical protein